MGESRSKVKNTSGGDDDDVSKKHPSSKVLWYLPIILRFKRLYNNVNDEKNIRWPADERKYDGKNQICINGHKICPIRESNMCFHQLQYGKKTAYLRHQKFLKHKSFNGERDFDITFKPLTREGVYKRQ